MNIKPINDNILVEPIEDIDENKSGIFIYEKNKNDNIKKVKIISVGNSVAEFCENEVVYVNSFSLVPVIKNEKFLINKFDIVAKL